MKDEALKLALKALDIVKIHFTQNRHVNEAITAIKQALAAQPAPVQDIEHCIWARNGNTPCPHTTPPAAQQDIQRLSALVRAQQITIDKLEQALAAPVQSCYCPNCEAMGKELAALKAQPAPVLEPVGTYGEIYESMQALLRSGLQRDQQIYMEMKDKPLYTTPPAAQPAPEQYSVLEQALTRLQKRYGELEAKVAAQPAVPDAFGTREGEHPQYIQGWNDCRAEMLKGMK